MRILIVDQCSSAKADTWRDEPVSQDRIDTAKRGEIVEQNDKQASDLYVGRQQKRITNAINILQEVGDDVERIFISAGFGVVDSSDRLPVYDVTFADLTTAEVDERAQELNINHDLRNRTVGRDYDIIFFALGSDYYRSAQLSEILPDISQKTDVVVFNREELAETYANVVSIPARTPQANEYGTIVVALKGEYIYNFAKHRQSGTSVASADEIKELCEPKTSQSSLKDY